MRVLIIDNYDSFTYNLYQYVGALLEVKKIQFILDVFRNNKITINEIRKKKYNKIIISPGPGNPADKAYFGVCSKVLTDVGQKIPVLGVCLGMQGIAYYFGGKVVTARMPMHGKTSIIKHDGEGIFKGLPQDLRVMRYHSLVADKKTLPKNLKITAQANGEIMGLRHIKYPIEGIQFHPESFATEGGEENIRKLPFSKAMNTRILLNKIADRDNLTKKEASFLLEQIIGGKLAPTQVAAVLVGLRTKGESVDEILGFIQTMRKHMIKINMPEAVDIVGTGGDGIGTFNISTTSSFVVAGNGVKVAKHGNRAASSICGSADVLEALGVNINLTSKQAEEVLNNVGMIFLFAPLYHPTMKNIAPIRKELGIRTMFNFLGPFLNPAETKRQLLGVANLEIAKKLAQVATKLKFTHLMIVTSIDGMDEITTTSDTRIFEVKSNKLKTYILSSKQFGLKLATKKDLIGGDIKDNAGIIKGILQGEKGPKRDVVILNSAAAFYISGKVKNIKMGIKLAEKSIDSGAALQVLQSLIKESKKYA